MDLIDRAQRSLAQKFSDDDVSVGYARQAMDSLAKLGELNESAFKYTMRYVEKIELATKKKREEDDAASDAARNHARQVG